MMITNYKPKGLDNIAGNCYMNSLLQCLYFCKEFRDEILNIHFDEEDSMVLLFKELFKELKFSKSNYIRPVKIKNKINESELFKNGMGSDAADLLDYFFNSICYELNPDNSREDTVNYESKIDSKDAMLKEAEKDIMTKTILDKIFMGIYEKESKCENGHCKYSFQIEYRIVFSLENISKLLKEDEFDLYDCFKCSYKNKEKTKEKCYANDCNEKMYSYEKIYENPKILIIILDRGYNKKFDKKVNFDFTIDISEYIDKTRKIKISNIYELIGVTTHRGSTGKYGHYISICLGDNNSYYYFNDYFVTTIDENSLKKQLKQSSPYILFYRRVDNTNNKSQIIRNNNTNLRNNRYTKNKKIEVYSKSVRDIIIENLSNYLYNFEFQKISSDTIQWVKEKKRKVKATFSSDEIEFFFEEKIQKIECCSNASTIKNKFSFCIKLNNINNSFINIFNERFTKFFQEI